MAEILVMLALSPTMDEGTLTKWRVKEGDSVSSGDVLCDVETDKATMDYESTTDGTILKLLLDEGGKAAVGDPIAIIGEEGEEIDDLIDEAESMRRSVEKEHTEKKEKESAAKKPEGEEPTPEEEKKEEPEDTEEKPQPSEERHETDADGERLKVSPLARKIAEQHGVDLQSIEGSGPGGRIVKADVEQAAQRGPAAAAGGPAGAPSPLKDETLPVTGKRAIIAQRLAESKFSAPHYYLRLSIGVDNLIAARQQMNESQDTKISYNAYLVKFAAETVKRHPMINASWQGDSIRKKRSIDVGLAVALDDGLITPVVRDCGSKGIAAINNELGTLIKKARSNELKQEEYTGATFTISTLGSFGIEEFTAIINPPASTILAVGMMEKRPVVGPGDAVAVRTMMTVTMSCDHRVIDGAVGAAFLQDFKRMVEYPIQSLY